jgi:hypothetical protein
VLSVAGEALRRQLGMDCNVFGGVAECKPLPPDSAFVKQCKGHNHEVQTWTRPHGVRQHANTQVVLRRGVYAGVQKHCVELSAAVSHQVLVRADRLRIRSDSGRRGDPAGQPSGRLQGHPGPAATGRHPVRLPAVLLQPAGVFAGLATDRSPVNLVTGIARPLGRCLQPQFARDRQARGCTSGRTPSVAAWAQWGNAERQRCCAAGDVVCPDRAQVRQL